MAFEYSNQSTSLTLKNPLKLHNFFLLSAAIIIGAFAIVLLFAARGNLAGGHSITVYSTIALALFLIAAAVSYLYACLSHLQFYFGRGRPHGLARVLGADEQGTTAEAEQGLKETLRQQALEYREPKGPIAGLLYAMVPKLIFAPQPLRQFAEWQFKGAVTLVT